NNQNLCDSLCKHLNIPSKHFKILKIIRGSTIVTGLFQSSCGERVIKPLKENSNIDDLKDVRLILLGEFDLDTGVAIMNPRWNRIYSIKSNTTGETYWSG
ncbi:unnamed protein product, partial [Didymodactylos carnosus]